MNRRAFLAGLASFSAVGCGRYGDFTLPAVAGGDPKVTFTWEPLAEPVLSESLDALNPSVVAGLTNLYSVFDGHTWRTARAASEDGIAWRKQGVVLEPDPKTWEGSYSAANGSALLMDGGELWYWYEAGPKAGKRIGLARGFRKELGPVLSYGPYMSWDERAVADPYVLRAGSNFYLYYLGQDRADPPRQRLGVARSADGVHWEKLRTNPILEPGEPGAFDENGVGEPAVWQSHGFYWMLYTGRDRREYRRLGLARSTDGVGWRKLPVVFSGTADWNAKVICDPSVMVAGSEIRVWFGGGDVASPDENLHGQIGYGRLVAK